MIDARARIMRRGAAAILLALLAAAGAGAAVSRQTVLDRLFLSPLDHRRTATARQSAIEYVTPRVLRPLTVHAARVCRMLAAEFDRRGRMPANPCLLPLPAAPGFARPAWKVLDPAAHIDVVKLWAFWEFWTAVSLRPPLDEISEPRLRALAQEMARAWRKSERTTDGMALLNPPADAARFADAGWTIYGGRIEAMIARGAFRLEEASFDFNRDGRPETMYRLTRLYFGFLNRLGEERPTLEACTPAAPRDYRYTMGLFASASGDGILQHSLATFNRLQEYDVFLFRGQPYTASRGAWDNLGDVGGISRVESSTYLPWLPFGSPGTRPLGAGVGEDMICQFDAREPRS